MFGMNMIRLHQKVTPMLHIPTVFLVGASTAQVNPERWYYHADKIGVTVLQDMVQKYGHASDATVPYFVQDHFFFII